MSFSGGGTNPPRWANKAFIFGCAFEHTITLTPHCHHINCPNGRAFYPCDMKWHCCKTYISLYLACPLTSNTKDSKCSTFFPLKKKEKGLINRIKVFDNKVIFHLLGYNWNSALIENTIWWSKNSNICKDFVLPS
jgi:hypothetical protein